LGTGKTLIKIVTAFFDVIHYGGIVSNLIMKEDNYSVSGGLFFLSFSSIKPNTNQKHNHPNDSACNLGIIDPRI
jgi:hypothetical protein